MRDTLNPLGLWTPPPRPTAAESGLRKRESKVGYNTSNSLPCMASPQESPVGLELTGHPPAMDKLSTACPGVEVTLFGCRVAGAWARVEHS